MRLLALNDQVAGLFLTGLFCVFNLVVAQFGVVQLVVVGLVEIFDEFTDFASIDGLSILLDVERDTVHLDLNHGHVHHLVVGLFIYLLGGIRDFGNVFENLDVLELLLVVDLSQELLAVLFHLGCLLFDGLADLIISLEDFCTHRFCASRCLSANPEVPLVIGGFLFFNFQVDLLVDWLGRSVAVLFKIFVVRVAVNTQAEECVQFSLRKRFACHLSK